MKFSEITKDLGLNIKNDFEVKGIAIDSREVKEGFIFFALKGGVKDGAEYIDSAVSKGAKAVFSESKTTENDVVFSSSTETNKILNHISKLFFAPMPANLIAVTGTNGKTSVANFTAALLTELGRDAASIGTLGTLIAGDYDKQFSYSGLTSPDIITLSKDLNALKKKNIDHAVMEASSHGLHQHRLGGLMFKSAAFTNFTQDHLDYHGSMDNYFDAKIILFTEYMQAGGSVVLNADIPEFEKIKNICENKNLKIISYGKGGKDIILNKIKLADTGLAVEVEIFGKMKTIETKLIGEFQAYNLACSIGLVVSLGFDVDRICEAASKLKPVKGRMDVIFSPKQNAKIVIDYAHTPDALEKAIESLRAQTSGKLITMFGCGGDRDKTKRPIMGKIASDKSDVVIVTDDNPRTEDAKAIRSEIINNAKNSIEIEGRKKAIEHSINLLKSGDSLLLAGKGHEDYQIIGKEKLPFDEFKIVKEILEKI